MLTDWLDPDGDDLLLLGARPTGERDQVRTRADGLLTFQDVGSAQGKKQVAITVSDGRDQVEGTVVVDVRAQGDLPPMSQRRPRLGEPPARTFWGSPLKNSGLATPPAKDFA